MTHHEKCLQTLTSHHSCFPHVINLAVQAIYAALKDGKGLEEQCQLENDATLGGVALPEGVTRSSYLSALKADVLGTARKLVATCRISGKRREEFVDTVLDGNSNETWVDGDGNPMSRKALQLLRDCETRWSSTYNLVDRVLTMLPVSFSITDIWLLQLSSLQVIEVFAKRPSQSGANITIPNTAEVCVLDHVRVVMLVPHLAQESLSSQRTPTLSYSLPFYHSIIDQWGGLKQTYPLLSPYIVVGIKKVEEYVGKSKHSQTYLLAVCKSLFSFQVVSMLTPWLPVLNPCLKIGWIEKNCSVDDVQRAIQMVLHAVSPTSYGCRS